MALDISAQADSTVTPSLAEEKELHAQLIRLRDAVVAGKHPHFKLPPAVIEQLKANLASVNGPGGSGAQTTTGRLINGFAFNSNAASTNNAQHSTPPVSTFTSPPGLQTPKTVSLNNGSPATLKSTSSGRLDPIFLEKSDSLVRAEGQLRRQRVERELQAQLEQRKTGVDKFAGADASPLDVEAILASAFAREHHTSGLKPAQDTSPASSFDTNDYYSSQVESEWSSPTSSSKGSDRAAGAFMADFERVDELGAPSSFSKPDSNQAAITRNTILRRSKAPMAQANVTQFGGSFAIDDEDDEYTPPDATAFDHFRQDVNGEDLQGTPPENDDNSEYEPGEITHDNAVPTPYYRPQQAAQPSPQVPVIRNHLTHIAAPQPNRVSPLAVAKHASTELELVDGRPEVVRKPHQHQHIIHSRGSTASPPNGPGGGNKKRRPKKRKRDLEPSGRGKRKRDRQNAGQSSTSPAHLEPRIKDEPVSPPNLPNISEIQPFARRSPQYQYQPTEVDLVSPRHVHPQFVYGQEPLRSGLQHDYAPSTSPALVRVASPAAYRPVQRDNQDLRRVASLHNAYRPPSPSQRNYSPAPYRTASMTYGDPRLQAASTTMEQGSALYQEHPAESTRYVRADRSPSPSRIPQYQDPYIAAQSPALMPPPVMPQRKIVVDQYGNQYYAAEPVPAPTAALPRASVAPVERHAFAEPIYERTASRLATSYSQTAPTLSQYEQSDIRMAPPPVPRRPAAEASSLQYVDMNGYRAQSYTAQPAEPKRYLDAPTSPAFQAAPQYEQLAPPSAPLTSKPTSPVYAPTRSYTARPNDLPQQPLAYAPRQASVVSSQYVRQEAPPAQARAMSVAPIYEHPPATYGRGYSQAPHPVQYVDQYGRLVYPGEVRQVPNVGSRYQ